VTGSQVRAGHGHRPEPVGLGHAEKVIGRERHIAVGKIWLVLAVVIIAASVQDRDTVRCCGNYPPVALAHAWPS
jgi:hypothetical protein